MSTEAEIGKGALADFVLLRDEKGWDAHLTNFPHDEINIECHESCVEEVSRAILELMDKHMAKYITSIPVNDNDDPSSLVGEMWSDK